MSRRGSGYGIATIYWRDIPAQVVARTAEGTEKVLLDNRFQVAIDRAAVVAGLTGTHAYVEQWRRETEPASADRLDQGRTRAAELDASFPKDRLETFVATGGLDPMSSLPVANDLSTEAEIQ